MILMIIERTLYGLKISVAAWREKLAENFMSIGHKLSGADADVCMKRDFKQNRYPYYKYMLCYVDEFFHIGLKTKEDADALNIIYRLKEGFGPPGKYIGENVEKVHLKDG